MLGDFIRQCVSKPSAFSHVVYDQCSDLAPRSAIVSSRRLPSDNDYAGMNIMERGVTIFLAVTPVGTRDGPNVPSPFPPPRAPPAPKHFSGALGRRHHAMQQQRHPKQQLAGRLGVAQITARPGANARPGARLGETTETPRLAGNNNNNIIKNSQPIQQL